MPARIVVVHSDHDFLTSLIEAITKAGLDGVGFGDPRTALTALERAPNVEFLITGIGLDGPQGIGVSLARVARKARPEVQVLFIARSSYEYLTNDVGQFMPTPANLADVVRVIDEMLTTGAEKVSA